MKASESLAWALGLLEFEIAVDFLASLPPVVPPLAEHRRRLRFYERREDGGREQLLFSRWLRLSLAADDAAGTIRLEAEPDFAVDEASGRSAVERFNGAGPCAAATWDAATRRITVRSAIRHQRHHGFADDQEAWVGQKEATLNWLVDVLDAAAAMLDGLEAPSPA